MRASSIGFLFLAAAGLLAPAAAGHAEDLLKSADPDLVLELAKGFGSAEIDKDEDGDPVVHGRIQGIKYVIYFYDCTKGENCRSIQFATGYTDPFTAEQANAWNTEYRWVRAYEHDGSNFRMDVDFSGGITRANLEDQMATWDSLIPKIKKLVGD